MGREEKGERVEMGREEKGEREEMGREERGEREERRERFACMLTYDARKRRLNGVDDPLIRFGRGDAPRPGDQGNSNHLK